MGPESRKSTTNRLAVLDSIRGHDSSVAHSFNHTGGSCPKCGNQQHRLMFCLPGSTDLPRLRSCELEGEHLHRVCGACSYPWIERPLDQAMLSETSGEVPAESEMAAALAVILERAEGAELDLSLVGSRRGWVIEFSRDLQKRILTLKTHPPDPQSGRPAHPSPQDQQDA